MTAKIPKDVMDERVGIVCEMVAEGKTIREIASYFNASAGTVLGWIGYDQKYAEQYARARDASSDLFESEIIDTAMLVSPITASADRVKIDAMKWVAARRSPRKYSERIQQDHISSDGSMSPIATVAEMTDEQLAAIIAEDAAK